MEDKHQKADKFKDCTGENCPIPLITTRETIMEAEKGQVIEIKGDHPQSFEEIPMALNSMGVEILEKKKKESGEWEILFKV